MFSDGQRALPSEPKALMGLVTHPGLSLRFFPTHPQSNRSAELSTPTSLPKLSPEGIQSKLMLTDTPLTRLRTPVPKTWNSVGVGGNGALRAVVA